MRKNASAEMLVTWWESKRSVKNTMGKYINCIAQNRYEDAFAKYFSYADDISIALNDGVYQGREAVKAFFDSLRGYNQKLGAILKKNYGKFLKERKDEELKGIGPFRFFPITNTIVEIAEDNKTAKGMWHSYGSDSEINQYGPDTRWTWGWFAVDFINEEGEWKIWHMMYVEDVNVICGNSWGRPAPEQSVDPVFKELEEITLPEFTVEKKIYERYSPSRKYVRLPRIPEPYSTFAETFSYDPE